MRETIFKCDCCKQKADVQGLSIPIRSYIDAAGSKDTENLDFELCVGCMGKLVLGLMYLPKAIDAVLNWLDMKKVDYRKG